MAVGAASQRAAPVDPSRHPERHAHSGRRVAGARVTPAPDPLVLAHRSIADAELAHATTLAALTPATAADVRIARALDNIGAAAAQFEAARLSVARDEVQP
jgi:hypothetical protein